MLRLAFLFGLLASTATAQNSILEIVPGGDSGVVLETTPLVNDDVSLEMAETNYAAAEGAILRMVDRVSGELTDLSMANGDSRDAGLLTIGLGECRYPLANPASDAFAYVSIEQGGVSLFSGWMIASSPALSALDHPRYDVWVMRCIRTEAEGNDG